METMSFESVQARIGDQRGSVAVKLRAASPTRPAGWAAGRRTHPAPACRRWPASKPSGQLAVFEFGRRRGLALRARRDGIVDLGVIAPLHVFRNRGAFGERFQLLKDRPVRAPRPPCALPGDRGCKAGNAARPDCGFSFSAVSNSRIGTVALIGVLVQHAQVVVRNRLVGNQLQQRLQTARRQAHIRHPS